MELCLRVFEGTVLGHELVLVIREGVMGRGR